MQTIYGHLGVDSGQMSIVPVELVKSGKYNELDTAVKYMQDNPNEIAHDGKIGLIFRIKEDSHARVYYSTEDGITSLLGFTTSRGISDNALVYATYRIKAGLYVVCDPCYALDDPHENRQQGNYFKVCATLNPGMDWEAHQDYVCTHIAVARLGNQPVVVCSSGYGDGEYPAKIEISEHGIRVEVDFMNYEDDDEESF